MANTDKFLDLQTGLPRLWDHVKDYVDEHSGGGSSVPISQDIAADTGSTDKVPSVAATETAINAAKTTLSTSVTSDASSNAKASTPKSVYDYAFAKSNISSNVSTDASSTTKVPSVSAIKSYVDGKSGGATYKTTTVSLTASGWTTSTKSKTVTVSGVTSSNLVFVFPAVDSQIEYASRGIYVSAQATNSLTFKYVTAPTASMTVNVVIFTQ